MLTGEAGGASASRSRSGFERMTGVSSSAKTAITAFGQHGAAELSYLVGLYALVSITLNTFDVPVPEA